MVERTVSYTEIFETLPNNRTKSYCTADDRLSPLSTLLITLPILLTAQRPVRTGTACYRTHKPTPAPICLAVYWIYTQVRRKLPPILVQHPRHVDIAKMKYGRSDH
jgi:hypothetical protein